MDWGRSQGFVDPQGENDNDGDEVEGSFIILPGNTSPQEIEPADNLGAEVNLNVFQLGLQQLSTYNDNTQQGDSAESTNTSLTEVPETSSVKSCNDDPTNLDCSRTSEREHENAQGTLNSVISHMSSLSTDSVASYEEANSRVTQLLEENVALRVFVRELNEKQKKFLENCKELEAIVAKSQVEAKEQERKYERSRSVIETLREKVTELELELQGCSKNQNTVDIPDTRIQIQKLQCQLEEKESLLLDDNIQIQDLKELLRKMGAEFNEAKSVASTAAVDISNLQRERDVLFEAFEDSKRTISKITDMHLTDQDQLKEMRESNSTLLNELAQIKTNFQLQVQMNNDLKIACDKKTEDIKALVDKSQTVRSHAEELERKMDFTSQDLNDVKAQMAELELRTRQKIALLEAEVAEKNIFLQQMEEYKSDFEEERKDKISMREAKVKIADDLTRLQLEFEEKEAELNAKNAELEKLHRSHLELANQHLNRNTAAASPSPTPAANRTVTDEFVLVGHPSASGFSANAPNEYKCPLCGLIFETQIALVTHAYGCGDTPQRSRPPSPSLLEFP